MGLASLKKEEAFSLNDFWVFILIEVIDSFNACVCINACSSKPGKPFKDDMNVLGSNLYILKSDDKVFFL